MKPLYTQEEFNNSKSTDTLPLNCYHCNKTYYKPKKEIKYSIKNNLIIKFCSKSCKASYMGITRLKCNNCNEFVTKRKSQIKKSKSGNIFCSRSCAATYNNKHKTTGTRRSKLEVWLGDQLNNLYPDLNILFNDKKTIGSELDIYIPSLNLAFELNGIFHYEPIYGDDKLNQIQENDQSKTKACHEHEIDLCIIDTSQQKYFKEKSSKKYLEIITTIINQRTMLNS